MLLAAKFPVLLAKDQCRAGELLASWLAGLDHLPTADPTLQFIKLVRVMRHIIYATNQQIYLVSANEVHSLKQSSRDELAGVILKWFVDKELSKCGMQQSGE